MVFEAEGPFVLLFSFESFKAYPSTYPSPHEVCNHFPIRHYASGYCVREDLFT